MSIVARDTGLITPGKKNIYNANHNLVITWPNDVTQKWQQFG